MYKILIIPYSRKLPNNIENPKNYPYFQQVVDLLIKDNFKVYQLVFGTGEPILNGVEILQDYTEKQQKDILKEVDCWISCDSYFQHFAKYENKPGIVVWTLSDPTIFGYSENINLYNDQNNFIKHEDTYLNWISIYDKYKDHIKTMKHLDPNLIFTKIKEYVRNNQFDTIKN